MNSRVLVLDHPRVSPCGSGALLLDAEGPLSLATQERIWRLSDLVRDWEGVVDAQPGMNNLLVVLDPMRADAEAVSVRLADAWPKVPSGRVASRLIEVGVVYGGETAEDLLDVAAHHRLTPKEVATLHASTEYTVFAPGAAPGFGYLYGLDPRLFTPRRQVPVMRNLSNSVLLGGNQIILNKRFAEGAPKSTPTGWYLIGRAPDVPVPFDLNKDPPNLVSLGDRIRFRIERIES